MILGLMITKIQGVEAQENIVVLQNKNENKTVNQTENKISDPNVIAKMITENPYDYGNQKKADEIMSAYASEIAKEKAEKEAERKRLEEEANKKKKVIVASVAVDTRSEFTPVYQTAASRYGIEWQLLRAVHIVETGGRGNTTVASYAGAQGPMQFMPSTFRAYAIDGDGDGATNINDVDDAIFSAANYLARNKAATDVRNALLRYNHSNAYVEHVLYIARSLGFSR